MTLAVARAEFWHQLRALRTPLTFAVFFGIGFLLTANAEEFERFAPGGTVLANSPYAITSLLIKLSLATVFAVPAFLADAILRDREHRFDGILFATPITKGEYLLGRYFGAVGALLVAVSGGPLGHLLGGFWPWADTALLGPVRIDHYLGVFLGLQVPSILAISAIVFAAAVLSRSLLFTYVATLGLLVSYLVAGSMESFPPLLDPFLFEVFDAETRYWTASERNTQLLPWAGAVLASRLLWTGVAAALLALAYGVFSFRRPARRGASDPSKSKEVAQPRAARSAIFGEQGTPVWGRATHRRQFWARTRFEMRAVLRSAPFVVVMALTFLLLVVELMGREVMYGVQAHPVTRLMLPDVFAVTLAVMAVLVFYSADVIWRERSHGIHQIVDALPTPNAVLVASKLTALVVVVACIYGLGVVIGAALQISAGTAPVDWGLFLERGFFFPLLPFVCLAVLTCFFQVLSANRYLGMMGFALFLGAIILSRDAYDLEHPLASFVFPAIPAPLSDMNGTGRFMEMGYWLVAYWVAIAGLLLVLTYLLFPRGTLQPLRYRLRGLRALKTRGFAIPSILLILSLFGTAGFLFYNTNILNEYHTVSEVEALRVDYEKRFRPYESLPMPRTIEVVMEVDLFPDDPRVEVRSTHVLENKTDQDLTSVHVVFPPGLEVEEVVLEEAAGELLDDRFAPYYVFELARPMAPLERRTLEFEARIEHRGFPHRRPDTRLVRNGTFLTDSRLAPTIGFESDYLIEDPEVRKEHGLSPLPRRPRLEDTHQHGNNVTRSDSDFIRFEATVSTVANQTAVTLGQLEREWVEGDRRFFHYVLEAPTRNLYPILSGEYVVARDRWQGIDLEVYYHASHEYNVERMMEAMRDSLELYGRTFGPYPFDHARIVEFPAYHPYAQALAGTIPFSEAMGFVADVQPGDIDMPYYVTAHEMAHMWWGHVVTAANVQGDGFIHETLAQYSALRLMEQKFGDAQIRRFLKFELDRYLAGRAEDPEGELPLLRVESQSYIHYHKGSLVMMGLRDLVGTEVVDRSLRRLVELRAFSSTPYATSADFLAILEEEAGAEHRGLIADLFEDITLYDLQVHDSEVRELPSGRFEVEITVETAKLYAESDGSETRAPFDVPVEIGIFTNDPDAADFAGDDVVYLERHTVEDGRSTLTLEVDRRPTRVGIDPYHRLIDRDTEDNLFELGSS